MSSILVAYTLEVKHEPDEIDGLMAQWKRERPDLDSDIMATFGRFSRIAAYASKAIDATLEKWGLQTGEFDVLAALRRSGAPFTLAPSQLTRAMMLSPSGMTSRLDRLERIGLIERKTTPDDRRSLLVVLTSAGLKLVDEAVTAHVENETGLLRALSPSERKGLDQALRVLLRSFETKP